MDKIRNGCLNLYLFRNIYKARMTISNYIDYYNTERPHSAIGYETPLLLTRICILLNYKCPENRGIAKLLY